MLRIHAAQPVRARVVRLELSDGTVVERDLAPLLVGPVFAEVAADDAAFGRVSVEDGSLVWPNGADLCPDVVIWGGPPPEDELEARPTSAA